jgi:hypothetical protein
MDYDSSQEPTDAWTKHIKIEYQLINKRLSSKTSKDIKYENLFYRQAKFFSKFILHFIWKIEISENYTVKTSGKLRATHATSSSSTNTSMTRSKTIWSLGIQSLSPPSHKCRSVCSSAKLKSAARSFTTSPASCRSSSPYRPCSHGHRFRETSWQVFYLYFNLTT